MPPPVWTAPPGTAALIFDCDGTLADTMPIHFKAWTAMMTRHGILFPEDRFYALGGMPTAQIIRLLAGEQSVVVADVDAMVVEKEELFLTHLEHVTPLAPVFAVAAAYHGVLPMAVASGGPANSRTHWRGGLVRSGGVRRGHPTPQAGTGRVPRSGPTTRGE
jgi:beta-phosphoglucomutase-like phosphatase (HAD superfamily)